MAILPFSRENYPAASDLLLAQISLPRISRPNIAASGGREFASALLLLLPIFSEEGTAFQREREREGGKVSSRPWRQRFSAQASSIVDLSPSNAVSLKAVAPFSGDVPIALY
ncbi:hypothetical protein NL676_013847 [Syzygium grande]|nr:hypothetical protein NL676_013847 [Syzygium grande]